MTDRRRPRSSGDRPATTRRTRMRPQSREDRVIRARRVRPEATTPATDPAPVRTTASFGGAWAAVQGLVVIGAIGLLAWIFAAGQSSWPSALRVSGVGWLASHLIPVHAGAVDFSVLPLALVVVPVITIWRNARTVAQRVRLDAQMPMRLAVAPPLVFAAAYAVVALVVALVASTSSASVQPLVAAGVSFVWALVLSACAMSREAGRSLSDWIPESLRRGRIGQVAAQARQSVGRREQRAVVGAILTLVLVSCLMLAASIALNLSSVASIGRSTGAGLVGGAMLLLMQVAYLPNAVIWTTSYLLGPGFVLRGDSNPFSFPSPQGAPNNPPPDLPPMPLLDGVPGSAPGWAVAVMLAPVAAGVVAALLLNPRRPAPLLAPKSLVSRAVVAGSIGAIIAASCFLASGDLGVLGQVGPRFLRCGAVALVGSFVVLMLTDAARFLWIRQRASWAVKRESRLESAPRADESGDIVLDLTDDSALTT